MERYKNIICQTLKEIFPECSIYERSDTKSRAKEGLPVRKGVVIGTEPDDTIYVREEGQVYIPVDIKTVIRQELILIRDYLELRQAPYLKGLQY